MDLSFKAILIESSGCMVQCTIESSGCIVQFTRYNGCMAVWYVCSEDPGSPTYRSPMPSALIFIVLIITTCRINVLKMTQSCLSSHEFYYYPGAGIFFQEHSDLKCMAFVKRDQKRILNKFGFCKISPFSAISAQVVAKSFQKPGTKIC